MTLIIGLKNVIIHCQFYTNNLHYKAPKAKQIASGVKLKIRGNGKIHIVMSCHYHMVMTFYHVAMKLPLPLPHGKITFYYVAMKLPLPLPHGKMSFYYVAMVRVISLPHSKISLLIFLNYLLKLTMSLLFGKLVGIRNYLLVHS